MAKSDKVYMPSGIGGLIRYQEEERVFIKMKPRHIIYIVAGIAVFEIMLKIVF